MWKRLAIFWGDFQRRRKSLERKSKHFPAVQYGGVRIHRVLVQPDPRAKISIALANPPILPTPLLGRIPDWLKTQEAHQLTGTHKENVLFDQQG